MHRPLQMKTDLENGRTAQNWTYHYDAFGNVTNWKDLVFEGNSQTFTYDATRHNMTYIIPYNPSIQRDNRANIDNPRYYYDEMIRKGIYYTPYISDFINGQGVFAQ
ncbi:MAG: hypothetical protein KDK90_27610 [Leptospiraceae bacterium]|nr:hypothetical protein [Leptospiraceae bacterium]